MSDNMKKPFNPYIKPDCPPPPPCPPGPPICDCPPPVPPCDTKPSPGCYPPVPPPGFGQVPPVPTVLEGANLYEAMAIQSQRVNQCIAQWNAISSNCFAKLQEMVAVARINDVYYSDKEVHYQEGYDDNDGCAYSIVEKKAVDCHGQPIRMNLCVAYDNTTNSGVKQSIFDVSFIKSANVIMTAVPAEASKWIGPAMIDGCAMPGIDPQDDSVPSVPIEQPQYVYGFNRHGVLRWFGNNVTDIALQQNQMVDVIGPCTPIVNDGQITPMAEDMTNKGAITALGFRSSDGSVFFFQCGAQDQPGMQGVNVAKLLQGFGCTTAVVTSFIDGTQKNFQNGMLYMGQVCQVPQGGVVPKNLAYWVISKRCTFRNEFEQTLANLVQTTGQNAWTNYLTGVEVQAFDERIKQNAEDILNEIERATQAEQDLKQDITDETARATEAEKLLQENINAEVNRAEQAEALLQENINKEQARAEAAETQLQKNIDAETARATTAEAGLKQDITDETTRATAAENAISADLAAEKLRAQTRENEIQTALDKEIRERISADNDIINAIEQEVLARRAADTAIENSLDAVKKELQGNIDGIQQQVNGFTSGQTSLPYLKLTGGQMTGDVTFTTGNTITVGRDPTNDMEVATKAYVDSAVGGGGTTPGGDVSKEYVDQQVNALQTQITGKVSKAGDTMTGDLNMGGNSIINPVLESSSGVSVENGAGGPGRITNLGAPLNDADAANKQYVDQAVASATPSGDFVPTEGGSMTGDLKMVDPATIRFQEASPARLARNASTRALVKATDIGSVYTDDTDMVVKSETGRVMLKGTGLVLSDGNGNSVPVEGISEIDQDGTALVKFGTTSTEIMGPVSVVNQAGGGAKLSAGIVDAQAVDIGAVELREHTSGGVTHLDINPGTSTGAVYINRTNNGSLVEGGTGELHVTEIHAPNELVLKPGTSVNVSGQTISGVTKIRGSGSINFVRNDDSANGIMAGIVNLQEGTTTKGWIQATTSRLRIVPTTLDQTVDLSNHRLSGVANGINDMDAVTVQQLNNSAFNFNPALGAAFLSMTRDQLTTALGTPLTVKSNESTNINVAAFNITTATLQTITCTVTVRMYSSSYVGTVNIWSKYGYIIMAQYNGSWDNMGLRITYPNNCLPNCGVVATRGDNWIQDWQTINTANSQVVDKRCGSSASVTIGGLLQISNAGEQNYSQNGPYCVTGIYPIMVHS